MSFTTKKRTREEWDMSARANRLRMVFVKDGLNKTYIVYKKDRDYLKRHELINTGDISELDLFFDKHEQERQGSYREIRGDLLKLAKQGKFDVIAHGCNCFATMGAGIAAAVKKEFPAAFRADKAYRAEAIERLGNFTFGDMTLDTRKNVEMQYPLLVFNLYSQYMPGPSLDEEALILSLRKMAMYLKDEVEDGVELKIGLPLIGCGIAGGDWDEVREFVKKELREFDVTVVTFNQ